MSGMVNSMEIYMWPSFNFNRSFKTPGDAWKYAVALIRDNGINYIDENGANCREVMNLMVTVLEPQSGWPIPGSNWDMVGLNKYAEQLLSGENDSGFDYTYGERLRAYNDPDAGEVDQVAYIIEKLQKNKTTRRAIAITWSPWWDNESEHVPCLQSVDFLFRAGKLHLTAYFRSQDVARAWPANLYGLSRLLGYVAERAGMQPGSITTISASAHIYEA